MRTVQCSEVDLETVPVGADPVASILPRPSVRELSQDHLLRPCQKFPSIWRMSSIQFVEDMAPWVPIHRCATDDGSNALFLFLDGYPMASTFWEVSDLG
jgi:hypothetical protein